MSTWSRMSSARFGKESESVIGPGSYEIPTTMDDHAPLIVPGGERFQESLPDSHNNSFLIYEDMGEKMKPQADRRKSIRRALSAATAKENRTPSLQNVFLKGEKGSNICQDPLELEQLRRRLLEEEKRRVQAEAKAADLAVAKKSAANAHAQLQSNERKLEQLQKELDDVNLSKKEAQKRACDLEADRGRGKKALYEKEQQAVALQKSLALAKAQLEERGKKLEDLSGDAERLRHESAQLRQKLEDQQQQRATTTPRRGAASTPGKASPSRTTMQFAQGILNGLEHRFAAQTAETEGQLRELAEAQTRLHAKVLEGATEDRNELDEVRERLRKQGEELEKRRAQLRFVLEQSKRHEAHLDAALVVREASLVAVTRVSDSVRESLAQAEGRAQLLEGQLDAVRTSKGQLEAQLQELQASSEQQAAEHQKVAERLAAEAAEARGKLFTAEQAQLFSQAAREDLQRQLSNVTEEAQAKEAELAAEAERAEQAQLASQAAREDLQRQLTRVTEQAQAKEAELAAEAERAEQAQLASQAASEDLQRQLSSVTEQAQAKEAELAAEAERAEQAQLASQAAREDLQRQLSSVTEQAQAKEAELAAEAERLQAELYETLAARAEAEQALAVKTAQAADLSQENDSLREKSTNLCRQKLEAEQDAQTARARTAELEEEAREVEGLRALAADAERSKAAAQRQGEELKLLNEECEEQRRQNKDLLESMRAYQRDLQRLEAENRALRQADAEREASLEREMERHAQSAGHTNHRQKIQHIVSIKEDNQALRSELKKARQRIAELEVARNGEVVSRVLAPAAPRVSCGGATPTLRRSSTAGSLHAPAGRPPALRRASGQGCAVGAAAAAAAADPQGTPRRTEAPLTSEEAMKRCNLKDRAFERLSADYQHLVSLVERAALVGSDQPFASEGVAAFLRRLCDVASAERQHSPRPATPATPLSAEKVAELPSTPTQRRRAMDGMSDLGDQSEVPEVVSEFGLDEDIDRN